MHLQVLKSVHDTQIGCFLILFFTFILTGGSVHSFLEEVKEETGQSGLNRNQSLYILHGLLSAVKALHDKRILHCDIKSKLFSVNSN